MGSLAPIIKTQIQDAAGALVIPIDSKTDVAEAKEYPLGASDAAIVAIPIDAKETKVGFSRDGWPDLGPNVPVVEIQKWYSDDGGKTFQFGGASQHCGGVWVHRNGKVATESTLTVSGLGNEKSPDRQLLVKCVSLVSPITTKVSVLASKEETIPDPVVDKV